jgi:putative ABC transport system permease protein
MAATFRGGRGRAMSTLWQDLRFAARALRRTPGFTAVALLSLALGIGVNSTLFSLVSAVQFRPLPYYDPDRIVDLHERNPRDLCQGCSVGTSYATFLDWRGMATSYSRMGAYVEDVFALSDTDTPVRVQGGRVSADLFPLLGVAPMLGRAITPDEDRPAGSPVVLLSHSLWLRQFAGDSSVVGRAVRLNGVSTTIIGVMPPRFRFPEVAELWTPIAAAQAGHTRDDRSLSVLARLKPGITVAHANDELARLAAGVASQYPQQFTNWTAGVTTLRADLSADSGPPFLLLLGASGFVLLIACANLANLLLSRALKRERDFAVRAALGASRARVARQLLTESLLLSLLGGGFGLLLALWGTDAVMALLPGQVPFWIDVAVDWRVVLFTFLASLVTGFTFGTVPALRSSRLDLHDTLKEGQRSVSATRGRGRLRSTLVVIEFAMALILLVGAGLMIETYQRVRQSRDLGLDPHGVLMARAELLHQRYRDTAQIGLFGQNLLARLDATPGAQLSALEGTRFLGTFVGAASSVTREGTTTAVPDNVVPRFARFVSPRYFALLRIPIHRGRVFTDADRPGAPGVAVLNEAAAAILWPGQEALGKRLKLAGPNVDAPWLTVVGIVGDTRNSFARGTGSPFIYAAFAQMPTQPITLLVRTAGLPMSFAPTARSIVAATDGDQPLAEVESLEDWLAEGIAPVSFFVRVLGALAALALALAAMGIFGVVSYSVSQRTHEIGVRAALGAPSDRILRLVVGHGLWLGGLGAAIGLTGAVALTRLLAGVLFGTSPTDPVVLGTVTLLLVAVAGIASAVPARRALGVNPVEALRTE